jgi:maleamate amidohydrolase
MSMTMMSEKPRAALILVDVIASFFEPGMPNYYPNVADVVAPMQALLTAARVSGAPVVHAVERHYSGFEDFEWRKLPRHHLQGAPDAAILPAFQPAGEREVLILKRRFSAFFATDLALFLAEQRIQRVVIAGVKTNVCIRATAQDAFANGFEPIVPREATNSNRPHLAEASLEDIDRYMGRVVTLDEAIGMLS